MGIERRTALRLLGGAFAGSFLPVPLRAAAPDAAYLSARADASGGYFVSGFSARGDRVFDLPLPGRGHSFALHPFEPVAVHFARRPGRFALAVDYARGTVLSAFAAPPGRHFYGHGVFGPGGRLLYATENDFEGGRGVVGIYAPTRRYARIGEFPSHGLGPHDIRLLADGETLVLANGGILTRPDLPRIKLNLPTMAPSLCHIDRRTGTLRAEHRLADALHQLSIRHLALGPRDRVAVAMQYEGPTGDVVPLVALHDPGRKGAGLRLLHGPPAVLRAMKGYCGSVCFDSSGCIIAVSAPRGDLTTFWDADSGDYLSSADVGDGSGVSPAGQPGTFLASSGRGGVFLVRARSGETRPLEGAFLSAGRWDNHLAATAARGRAAAN